MFVTSHTVLYYISHRGQELVRNLLGGYAGVLMSDGWQAYRWLGRRLRCWAHLKRKAQGKADSLNPAAQGFGREVLALRSKKPAKALPACPCAPHGRGACGGFAAVARRCGDIPTPRRMNLRSSF